MEGLQGNIKIIRKNGTIPGGYLQLSEYAKRIDVSRARVSKALNIQRAFPGLKKGKNVFVAIEEADRFFRFQPARAASRVLSANVAAQKSKLGKPCTTNIDLDDIDYSKPPGENDSLQALLKRQAFERARKLKIENDLDEGLTILKQPTMDKWFQIGRSVRDALETIPAKISSRLEGKSRHEIEQSLISEIKQALTNLTKNIT